MGSPPGIGPVRSDEAEAPGPSRMPSQGPRRLRLAANSSGLDLGMPVDLGRFGKTTLFLNFSSPRLNTRAPVRNTRSKKQGSIYCLEMGKLNSPIKYEKLPHELPARPCRRSQ
jgi:hypothetical protein